MNICYAQTKGNYCNQQENTMKPLIVEDKGDGMANSHSISTQAHGSGQRNCSCMCKIWLFQIVAQPCGEKKISYGRFLTCPYKEYAGTCLIIISAEAIRDGSTYCQKTLVDWTLVATSPACFI
jgi:hypothetical protein